MKSAFHLYIIYMELPQINRANKTTIIQAYLRELRNNSFADETIRTYKRYIIAFLDFSFSTTDMEPMERVARFIDEFDTPVIRSQAYSAVKNFYILILHKPLEYKIQHRKKKNNLPDIWSRDDILLLLSQIRNKKHRLMLSMLYGSGLRVSELVRIRIRDLNLDSLILTIDQGKGNKKRRTVISNSLLEPLQKLITGRNSNDYLFLTNRESPYTKRTVQQIFYNASRRANIRTKGSCHTLRHSFATHLMENGTNIKTLQNLLGHKSADTTMVYVHILSLQDQVVESPL